MVDETENDWLSLCPYHSNTDTPAFSTSKLYGYSMCFNPACSVGYGDRKGRLTLDRLVREHKNLTHFEAKRFILFNQVNDVSFEEQFDAIQDEPEELPEFSASAIAKMSARFWETPDAVDYMHGRGFEDETLRHFGVGFTPATKWPAEVVKPDMIVVPAYDQSARPVGLVGRGLYEKSFKNFGPLAKGRGFQKSKILWNLNNARKHGETVVITESTFDSMRVHQAGYPNTVAVLGGSLSKEQEALLLRNFTKIIIMTDYETGEDIIHHRTCSKCRRAGFEMCQGHQPGRDLGMKIAERCASRDIRWAMYDTFEVYAGGVKDAAAMTDDQIRQSLRNAVSHFDYLDWVA